MSEYRYEPRLGSVDPDLPDYLFLIASNLTPEAVPQSGYLRPEYATNAPRDILDEVPKWAISSIGLFGVVGSEFAQAVVRAGYLAQSRHREWQALERREKDRLNDSIDRLLLANHAMFTLMSEEWGITEDDVADRMQEILRAEFNAFAASVADDLQKTGTTPPNPESL